MTVVEVGRMRKSHTTDMSEERWNDNYTKVMLSLSLCIYVYTHTLSLTHSLKHTHTHSCASGSCHMRK
jgi:hypothetical protein